jgi:hypothetical protein
MARSHWTFAGFVPPRTTACIMGSRSIDEVPGQAAPPRDGGGTDLPSVIARIGRKLAWRSPDAGPGTQPSNADAGHAGGELGAEVRSCETPSLT